MTGYPGLDAILCVLLILALLPCAVRAIGGLWR